LHTAIARHASRPFDPAAERLLAPVRDRFRSSLAAVVLYGSTLHSGDLTDGLADLFVIIDSYRAYEGRMASWFNQLLPPNVYYLEVPGDPGLRCKYAVMSLPQFERACSSWFHPYVWARFAQPSRLLYARDETARSRILTAFGDAVLRFVAEAAPLLPDGPVDSGQLWSAGLAATYASELRAEKDRGRTLTHVHAEDFARLLAGAAPRLGAVLESLPDSGPEGDREKDRAEAALAIRVAPAERSRARRRWWLRRVLGRPLAILRLMKAAFTFEGGPGYLAWKVERHTGTVVEVTPWLDRHPVLGGLVVLWRLLRDGTVR
jgi:hypothetical protein